MHSTNITKHVPDFKKGQLGVLDVRKADFQSRKMYKCTEKDSLHGN